MVRSHDQNYKSLVKMNHIKPGVDLEWSHETAVAPLTYSAGRVSSSLLAIVITCS